MIFSSGPSLTFARTEGYGDAIVDALLRLRPAV